MTKFVIDIHRETKAKLLRDQEIYKKLHDNLYFGNLKNNPPSPHITKLTQLTIDIWSGAKSLRTTYIRLFHSQRLTAPQATITRFIKQIEEKTAALKLAKWKYHSYAKAIAINKAFCASLDAVPSTGRSYERQNVHRRIAQPTRANIVENKNNTVIQSKFQPNKFGQFSQGVINSPFASLPSHRTTNIGGSSFQSRSKQSGGKLRSAIPSSQLVKLDRRDSPSAERFKIPRKHTELSAFSRSPIFSVGNITQRKSSCGTYTSPTISSNKYSQRHANKLQSGTEKRSRISTDSKEKQKIQPIRSIVQLVGLPIRLSRRQSTTATQRKQRDCVPANIHYRRVTPK